MTMTSLPQPVPGAALRTPPTIGRLPLGVLPEFGRNPLGLYLRAMRNYGDVVRMRFGPRFSYSVFHPEYVKHILVDNNKNYRRNRVGNDLLKSLIGENLLTGDGDFWLRQRRIMQPAFHRQRILGFGRIITESAGQMLAQWDQLPAAQTIDMAQAMMQVTLQVVGLALFSHDLLQDSTGLSHSIAAGSAYFSYRLSHLFAPPLWVPTKRNRTYKAAVQAVAHVVPEMIAARRKAIESGNGHVQQDMLDLLLAARYEDTGEGMRDEQLATEIRMFIAAGHETTSNALTWTLYLLSQHPEVEARLQAEVDHALAGRIPTVDDLPRLPYVKQVLEEAMRLYPSAWIVARSAIAEDRLGEFVVPAGQGLAIPIFAVHRHPDFWADPERFDPERFSPTQSAAQHRFAYCPFGGGPRQCIGSAFAMTEAQLILAMIAQRYQPRLQTNYVVEPEPLVTLRVRGGLPMKLEKRNAANVS